MSRPIDGDNLTNNLKMNRLCILQECENDGAAVFDEVVDWIRLEPTLTPPNEALTLEDAKKERYIWFTPLNDWAKVTPFGVLFFGSEELMNWETLCEEWGYRFKAYRRPPEGEA